MESPLRRAFTSKGRPTLYNDISSYFARSVAPSTPNLHNSKYYFSVLRGFKGDGSTCASQRIDQWVLGQLLPVVIP